MHKKHKLLALAALLCIMLPACMNRITTDRIGQDRPPNQNRTTPYSANSPDGSAIDGRGMNMGAGTGTGGLLQPDAKLQVEQQIADKVAVMSEVKSANVLVANNNAYVAVVLRHGSVVDNSGTINNLGNINTDPAAIQDTTHEVKNRIAKEVRSVNPNIKDVYVSANPDFVERMNSFARDVQNGQPVSGFMEEFNNIFQRIFPTQSGTNVGNMTPSTR